MKNKDEISISKETFEQIKYYAQCGYDIYTQRSPYVDYQKLAEFMKDHFKFILSELEQLQEDKDERNGKDV